MCCARNFLLAALSIITGSATFAEGEDAGDRPNIVFVMTDDQGYWDTGVTGNPHIDTPHMNRVANEGIQLQRYYAAPVCAPTRAGIMTGRYYLRTGLYNTRFGGDSLGKDEVTIAELLRDSGYRTGLFGKWHLGKYPGYQPQQRGFDEFFGHYHGHIERYQFPDQVYHNGERVEARGYVSELFTDASIDFITHSVLTDRKPFFCALMFNAPHSPWLLDTSHAAQPEGDKLLTKYLERGLPIREARIYALVERVDQNIGRLLDTLDKLEIAEETLFVFTSDNGGVSKFWKGGMNGQKSSAYEGGVRAPCFIRWPGHLHEGETTDALTSHIDWLPTFCELARCDLPTDRVIDGKSLVPLIQGEVSQIHSHVYHTWDRYQPNPDMRWGISDTRWKLLGMFGAGTTPDRSRWRLYDLADDAGETRNLARQHPEIVRRLRSEFERWFGDVTDGIEYAPIRIPVGHPANDTVELSPSWATWSGTHTNYTFDGYDWDTIDGWKEPGDRAVWRLDVQRPGSYQVKLSYGCRPVDAGGTILLRSGESMIEHTVAATATANQFSKFDAGTLTLDAGETELVIEVAKSTGAEVMRLNAVTLEIQH